MLRGALRGSGNTFASMILTIFDLWILLFPLAYFLSQHTGLKEIGIWIAFPISDIIAAIVTVIWFLRGTWKKKKITEEIKVQEIIDEETIIGEGIN